MMTAKPVDSFRREKMAKIHVAKKWAEDNGYITTDDDYRDTLKRVAGVRSSADAGPSQLDEILRHFTRLGWKPTRRKSGTKTGGLIRGMWKDHSREKTDEALRAFVRRCLDLPDNVEKDPDYLTKEEADKVLAALRRIAAADRKEAVKRRMGQ